MKHHRLFSAALLLLVTSLRAQVAPSSSPTTDVSKEEPELLNPFYVKPESDPQRAANTSAGTMFNTDIKQLPVQVQVMTPEFMESIGARDIYEAIQYAGNMQLIPQAVSTNPFSVTNEVQPNIYMRGFSTGQIFKDGFKRSVIPDTFFISRVDVLSGPGGALYGQGNMGGAVAYSSLTPPKKFSSSLNASFGNYDFARVAAKVGGPLLRDGTLSYVFPVTVQKGGVWYMDGHDKRFAMNPTVNWKPFAKTKVTLSYELSSNDRARMDNGIIADKSLLGVDIPNRAKANDLDRLLKTPDFRTFRWSGPDTYGRQRGWTYEALITQEITPDLYVMAGYNLEEYHRSSLGINPSLLTNAQNQGPLTNDPRYQALLRSDNAILRYLPADYYGDGFTKWPTWMGTLYYRKNFSFVENQFIVGGSYAAYKQAQNKDLQRYITGDSGFDYTKNVTGVAGSNINGNTVTIASRVTADQELGWYRSPLDYTSVFRMAAFKGVPKSLAPTYTLSNYFDKNFFFNSISKWFHGRLITNIGGLYTRNDRNGKVFRDAGNPYGKTGSESVPGDPDFLGYNVNPYATFPANARLYNPFPNASYASTLSANGTLVAGRFIPVGVLTQYYTTNPAVLTNAGNIGWNNSTANLNGWRRHPIYAFSPSISASFMATPDLNMFINGSSAINPGEVYSNPDGNNHLLDAPIYRNLEGGLKWEAWHGKIWLDASYYQTKTNNGVNVNVPYAFNNWNTSGFSATVGDKFEVKGYGFGIDYKVTDSLRLFAGYSHNTGGITFMDAFKVPANPDPAILARQQASTLKDGSLYIGVNPNRISKDSMRARIRYDFRSGPLKGLWVQSGMQYDGPRLSVSVGSITFDANNLPIPPTVVRTTVSSKMVYNADMGYNWKIREHTVRFVFNVSNVFDNQQWFDNVFNAPPTYRLSSAIDF